MVRAVTINDTPYSLERRGPLFALRKQPAGPTYTGSIFPDWCSCPAFRFKRGVCKHILGVLSMTETATKEKVADAEFTATVAPTTHLPAVVAPEPASAPMPLGRALAIVPRLAGALIKAQAKCRSVEKDARNTFHKYSYASAEAIIEEAKGPLNECGLALMPIGLHVNGHDKDGEHRFELEREFLLLHESGESVPIRCHWPICPDKGRPLDKATASADTTSLAYTLRDLLLMPRVDQADDMSGRDDTPKPAAPVKPAAAKLVPVKPVPAKPVKPVETEGPTSPPEPCISADDVASLRRLVVEHKADEKALRARFKVKVLEDLRASQYQDAVKYLTGNLPLTDEQQQKIRATIDELKIGAKQVKERLHDLYRVETLSQLKRVQASDLLNRLAASKAVKNAPAVAGAV